MNARQRLAMAHAELLLTLEEVSARYVKLTTDRLAISQEFGESAAGALKDATKALRELLEKFAVH